MKTIFITSVFFLIFLSIEYSYYRNKKRKKYKRKYKNGLIKFLKEDKKSIMVLFTISLVIGLVINKLIY